MTGKLKPRPKPCISCPYRQDVPSGIWAESEYNKLPGYDGSTLEQMLAGAVGLFMCHQADGHICSGWAGCHDMGENFAVRVSSQDVDPGLFTYESPVPLFASGKEAAEHGKCEIEQPSEEAKAKIARIARVREKRGRPVR